MVRTNAPHRHAALGVALTTLWVAGCNENILPDPESRAFALPVEADMAAGATHDVLVVACQDRVTLEDLLAPVVIGAIFVGLGRLDVAFYVPDAVAHAAIPSCDPVDFTVSGGRIEGEGFELMPTDNGSAFHVQATEEGEGIFRAEVAIGGEVHEVATTLRAWTPDAIEFAPACVAAGALPVLAGWVPAGGTAPFSHGLYRGEAELAGYGVPPVSHPRLSVVSVGRGTASVAIDGETGTFTVTSPFDPGYSLALTAYGASAYDALTLTRASSEVFFVGQVTSIRPEATIGGAVPCVSGYLPEVTIETPAVCGFEGRPDIDASLISNNPVGLAAMAPGTCRLRVELPGTPLVDVLEIPVFDTFDDLGLGTELDLSQRVLDLTAAGTDDIVVVGYDEEAAGRLDGLVLRWTGGSWARPSTLRASGTLRAVHTAPSGAVFAVANDGNAATWDGTAWTVTSTATTEDLYAVWASAHDDVFAAGDAGTLVHFDGASWSLVPLGIADRIWGVWDAPDGDLYLASSGSVLRWDGATLHPVPPDAGEPTVETVRGRAQAVADGTVYSVGGRDGQALVDRFDGRRTVSMPLGSGRTVAITIEGNTVWALTDRGLHRYVHDPSVSFP